MLFDNPGCLNWVTGTPIRDTVVQGVPPVSLRTIWSGLLSFQGGQLLAALMEVGLCEEGPFVIAFAMNGYLW